MKTGNNFRKAQLSFFIVIGFLILFVMSFLFYINKKTADYKVGKESIITQETSYGVINIKQYITSCLEKTARDGMRLLGTQGGRIYPWQSGITTPYVYEMGVDYAMLQEKNPNGVIVTTNVSYGLDFSQGSTYSCDLQVIDITCNSLILSASGGGFFGGAYPWMNFPNPTGSRDCKGRQGCFGENFIPTLDGNYSMYNQLKNYITNKINDCIDFSVFQGFNITLNGTVDVGVNTTGQTVVVVLKYPVIVTDSIARKQTKIDDFYYDTKVRLKELHNISNIIANNDKNDENFYVRRDTINLIPTFDEDNMEITILRNNGRNIVITNEQDNIVRIIDNFSSPAFVFQFARKNRPPVLEIISSPRTVSFDTTLTNAYFENISTIYDPDEDSFERYYISYELFGDPIQPFKDFSRTIDDMKHRGRICTSPDDNSFMITLCVSDNKSFTPAQSCSPADTSKDWQEIKFLTNCD